MNCDKKPENLGIINTIIESDIVGHLKKDKIKQRNIIVLSKRDMVQD